MNIVQIWQAVKLMGGQAPHQFIFQPNGSNVFSTIFFQNYISGHIYIYIYMKDAEWVETNEKSIFWFLRFLVLEIWSFFFQKRSQVFDENWVQNRPLLGKFLFHLVQLIPHIFCKFDHFWTTFYWSVTHLKIQECYP